MLHKKIVNEYSTLVRFYRYFIISEKWILSVLLLMPIIWCSAETYAPYLIKIIIDKLESPSRDVYQIMMRISLLYVSLMILIESSLRLSSYICIRAIPRVKENIRALTLTKIQEYPLSFFQNHRAGELLTAYKNLVDGFEQCIVIFIYGIYPIIITFIVSLILIGHINTIFAVIFTIWFLGMNVITFYFYHETIQASADSADSEIKMIGFIGDLFRNNILFKTFNSKKIDQILFDEYQDELTKKHIKAEWVVFKADSARGFLSCIFLSMIFIFLVHEWKTGTIKAGDFAFITTICFYARRSTWMATVQLLTFIKHMGIAQQSFKLLVNECKKELCFIEKPKKRIEGDIHFESINFGYTKNTNLYTNFNLYIPTGQKVGMMGSSGSGKTTLIHLLLKLLEPDTGQIYLEDYPISNLDEHSLNTYISYVSQAPVLFHRSIHENIRYGNPNASFDDIIKASKACLCHEFVSRLESGYTTLVGEDGNKLSGGQRQRIALARAYLKNAPILMMDEATSALDFATEDSVFDSFLSQQKTMFIISHRISILRKLDRILILEDGKIIKDGNPKDILTSEKEI